jgi:hypothetical protein
VKKETKIILVVVALAIAGYIAVRWYENRQVASNGNTQGGAADGSNLNSIAPELVGGSTGPSIGPALSTPVTINVTSSAPPASANPTAQMVGGSATPSPLALSNPSNSATGAQASAPVNSTSPVPAGATSAGTGPTAAPPPSTSPTSVTATPAPAAPVNKAPPKTTKAAPAPIKRQGAPAKTTTKPKAKTTTKAVKK